MWYIKIGVAPVDGTTVTGVAPVEANGYIM